MTISNSLVLINQFGASERGSIGIITALVALPLITGVGASVDYARAASCRMKLDTVANGAAMRAANVSRHLQSSDPSRDIEAIKADAVQEGLRYFDAMAPNCASLIKSRTTSVNFAGETITAEARYSAEVATVLMQLIGFRMLPLEGMSRGRLTSPPRDDLNMPIDERFDNPGPQAELKADNGDWLLYNVFNGWFTGKGGSIEIHPTGFDGPPPQSPHRGVLETDPEGNDRISKLVTLETATYELRFWYRGRLSYNAYSPVPLCGVNSQIFDWANATSDSRTWAGSAFGVQSNRVGVYLSRATTTDPAQLPKFMTEQDGHVFTCIHSANWIEASVKVRVAAGAFWLTFQGEGASDTHGGYINHIRLCKEACDRVPTNPSPPPRDNFPWAANTVLFEEYFAPPQGGGSGDVTSYALNNSGAGSGWPTLPAGWTTTPFNNIVLRETGRGNQRTHLAALDTVRDSRASTTNRSIHRRFLLAPGYYQVAYVYSVDDDLRMDQTHCGLSTFTQDQALVALSMRSTRNANTNIMSLYVDSDFLHASPSHQTALFAPANWLRWDGSAPPAGTSRIGQTRIDACVNADTSSVTRRTATFKIEKPGFYWLTFAAEGAADGFGPRLDNVVLTAVGGLFTSPGAGAVTVPAPGDLSGAWVRRGRFNEVEVQVQ